MKSTITFFFLFLPNPPPPPPFSPISEKHCSKLIVFGGGDMEMSVLIASQIPYFHQGLEQEEHPWPPKTHVLIPPPLFSFQHWI